MSSSSLQFLVFVAVTFFFTSQVSAAILGCNGGLGVYKTVKGNIKTSIYKSYVDACLKEVKKNHVLRWGCYSASSGPNCKCNLDSNYIFNYETVYNSAIRSMMVATNGFGYNEAETYEGNMYISYQCKQAGEGNGDIPGDEE